MQTLGFVAFKLWSSNFCVNLLNTDGWASYTVSDLVVWGEVQEFALLEISQAKLMLAVWRMHLEKHYFEIFWLYIGGLMLRQIDLWDCFPLPWSLESIIISRHCYNTIQYINDLAEILKHNWQLVNFNCHPPLSKNLKYLKNSHLNDVFESVGREKSNQCWVRDWPMEEHIRL